MIFLVLEWKLLKEFLYIVFKFYGYGEINGDCLIEDDMNLFLDNLIVFWFFFEICIEMVFYILLVYKFVIVFLNSIYYVYDVVCFVLWVNIFFYYIVYCLIKLNFVMFWWFS